MAALSIYTIANVLVNGALLAEEMSVTVSRDTAAQEISTVSKGFAGVSPGAAKTTIEVECAVPAADFELDPAKYWSNNGTPQVCEFTTFAAGRAMTGKFFIISDNFSHAVNSPSKLKFTAVGQFSQWSA